GSDRLNTNSSGSSNTSRSGRQSTSGPLRSSSKYARRSGDRPHISIPTFNRSPPSNGAPTTTESESSHPRSRGSTRRSRRGHPPLLAARGPDVGGGHSS